MIEHQWEMHGLLRRHLGIVTAAEIEASDLRLHADPRFSAVDYLIEDLRGCTSLMGLDGADLRHSSARHSGFLNWPDSFRHAWVSRWRPASLFGHSSAEAQALPPRIRTFGFIADARDWIDGACALACDEL